MNINLNFSVTQRQTTLLIALTLKSQRSKKNLNVFNHKNNPMCIIFNLKPETTTKNSNISHHYNI